MLILIYHICQLMYSWDVLLKAFSDCRLTKNLLPIHYTYFLRKKIQMSIVHASNDSRSCVNHDSPRIQPKSIDFQQFSQQILTRIRPPCITSELQKRIWFDQTTCILQWPTWTVSKLFSSTRFQEQEMTAQSQWQELGCWLSCQIPTWWAQTPLCRFSQDNGTKGVYGWW